MSHSDHRTAWTALADLVEEEITASETLLAALMAETEALEGKDPKQVENCAGRKVAAVKQVEQLESRRRTLFNQLGLDEQAEILPQLANAAAQTPNLSARWEALVEIAAQCHEQNQRNGYLIKVHSQYASELLNALTGQYPSGTLYDPKGQKRSDGNQHSLAKA